MLSILISTAVATFIYFVLIKPFRYWHDQGVIQYNLRTVWLKILLGFIPYRSFPETIQKVYQDFPEQRYCGIYQFLKPALLVRDPELIKQITVKDFDHFMDHSQIIPEGTEPLMEKNLLTLKGDKWREMRSTLSPSFTGSKMKIMFGLMSDCAQQFVQHFEEQGQQTTVVEMKDIFTRFTNDVIASSAFGVTCNSLKDKENEFYLMGKEITNFSGFFKNLTLLTVFMAPYLSKILRLELFSKRAVNFFGKVIKENVEIREKNEIVRPDMIHLLMESRKMKNNQTNKELDNENLSQEEKLNIEDITAQALIFFFAGFETVSTAMCFMAYELAVNVDIQQRLQNEIAETLKECEGTLTYEALMKMKYMNMVISESMRKWTGGVGDRVCVKPYTIIPVNDNERPVHLKKGDVVTLPIFALHRDPLYYPQPEKFDPERFNDENKSGINPYAFIPFGAGPRICIGNRFALMEIKLVFSYILSKFDIVVVEKTTVPLKIAKSQFILNSEGGFWLGLKPRRI